MVSNYFDNLSALIAVAEERSFTRAAESFRRPSPCLWTRCVTVLLPDSVRRKAAWSTAPTGLAELIDDARLANHGAAAISPGPAHRRSRPYRFSQQARRLTTGRRDWTR